MRVVATTEVIVDVLARVEPNDTLGLHSCAESSGIDSMAADSLLLVARYLVQVRQVHELWNWIVQEDEVSCLMIVRVQVQLVVEPVYSLSTDARFAWNAVLKTSFVRGVQGVDAHDFILTVWCHDWDSRGEVTHFVLIIRLLIRIADMRVPHVSSPAQLHTVAIIKLMQVVARPAVNFVASSPDPRHLSGLDELQSAREVIVVVFKLARVDDVTCQHDKIWLLIVQHSLDQALRLQVVLRVVVHSNVTESDDLERTVIVEFERARILVMITELRQASLTQKSCANTCKSQHL